MSALNPMPTMPLGRARDLVARELETLLRPEVVDRILRESLGEMRHAPPGDPLLQLRALVGAHLLETVADTLGRIGRPGEATRQVRPAKRRS